MSPVYNQWYVSSKLCQENILTSSWKLTLNKRGGRMAARDVKTSVSPPTTRRVTPMASGPTVHGSVPVKKRESKKSINPSTMTWWTNSFPGQS